MPVIVNKQRYVELKSLVAGMTLDVSDKFKEDHKDDLAEIRQAFLKFSEAFRERVNAHNHAMISDAVAKVTVAVKDPTDREIDR